MIFQNFYGHKNNTFLSWSYHFTYLSFVSSFSLGSASHIFFKFYYRKLNYMLFSTLKNIKYQNLSG